MADKYQTQCPHCGVKFQITDQQLALANGTVRCGSCLQVFQASQNLVPLKEAPPSGVGSARAPTRPAAPPPTAPAAKPAAPARPPRPAPAAPVEEVDGDELADKILREIEESAAAARAARAAAPPPATPPPPPPPAAAATPKPPATPVAPPPAAVVPSAAAEPQWAPPPAPPKPGSAASRYGIEENKLRVSIEGSAVDRTLLEGDDPFGASANTLLDEVDEPVDESWAKELLGERPVDEKEERVRKFTQFKADDLAMATTGVQSRSALEEQINKLAGSEAPSMAPPLQRAGSTTGLEDDELDFLNEPGLTMQDVELPGLDSDIALNDHREVHTVSWGRDAFWGTLSAVCALVLFGQYLVFNADTLARDEDWRSVYEAACGAVGCTLPGNSDIARIQGANLVIRSHPKAAGALVVDAIVYNRAPFAQPYPRLELGFSDMQGNAVAGRVFSAAEYLKGEVSATDLMPPDTPVHLTLELVDPGAQAVNYELRFLPPDAS